MLENLATNNLKTHTRFLIYRLNLPPGYVRVRVHICPYCGLVLGRDVNAARVLFSIRG